MNSLKVTLLLFYFFVLFGVSAQQNTVPEAPEDWRAEHFHFPLGIAIFDEVRI